MLFKTTRTHKSIKPTRDGADRAQKGVIVKIAVVYYSQGGNTKKVAETIAGSLAGDVLLASISDNPDLQGYNLVFVGMPIHRFGPPEPVKDFLKSRCVGLSVALFITHAADESMQEVKPWLEGCRQAADCANIVGLFHCQGQVADTVKQSWIDSGIPMLVQFGKLSAMADGQPDESRLARARAFAQEMATAVQ